MQSPGTRVLQGWGSPAQCWQGPRDVKPHGLRTQLHSGRAEGGEERDTRSLKTKMGAGSPEKQPQPEPRASPLSPQGPSHPCSVVLTHYTSPTTIGQPAVKGQSNFCSPIGQCGQLTQVTPAWKWSHPGHKLQGLAGKPRQDGCWRRREDKGDRVAPACSRPRVTAAEKVFLLQTNGL